jgi:acyl carrier protein
MEEIRQRVVALISELSQTPEAEIRGITALSELERWDSLLVLNLVLGLEREFDIQLDIQEIGSIATLPGVVELIERKRR